MELLSLSTPALILDRAVVERNTARTRSRHTRRSAFGPRCGRNQVSSAIVAMNRPVRISPGTTPARKSWPIDSSVSSA